MAQDERGEPSLPNVDARLWGKFRGLPAPYPVICHLVDTAAIAGALWDAWGKGLAVLRRDVTQPLPDDGLKRLVCFWAGLHDLGKISPSFQSMVAEPYQELIKKSPEFDAPGDGPVSSLRHNEVTQWGLIEIFRELGYPAQSTARRDVGHQVAQLLGGHHGLFCQALSRAELRDPRRDGVGEGAWAEQRRAHAQVLQELTGADEPLGERLPTAMAVVVLGIVIVADWLASQEDFILGRLPSAGWEASSAALAKHWQRAVADAPQVVQEAGLGRARFAERTFSEVFPFTPNALQSSVISTLPKLVNGPGLLLVTAPPGDGKTEVALHGAAVLARACGTGGLGFCLPTMATTDAMHKRIGRYAGKALLGDAALTRVHSMAWLSTDTPGDAAVGAADAGVVVTDAVASVEASRWLHSNRRGLLAPLSTFTIDQALTGVLPVKYNVLRLLALAGKVVVIDEAHSYDAWMHALLVRLLEWLGALKSPVVLLSATLTGRSARSLVEAYLRGSGHATSPELKPCYPGWLFADAVTGHVSEPVSVISERERDLFFDLMPVRRGDASDQPGHRLTAIQELLQPMVESDVGCVLVCCTTVREAQDTFEWLADWFADLKDQGGQPPALRLLHSRFRTMDRAAIIAECEADFGKDGSRPRTVLVSTQIIEQSLDLDFDLLITDLAPMALLIQRAGRCQRHRNKDRDLHGDRRPAWITEALRIVVLDPVDDNGVFMAPREWGDVYDESLLRRTSALLHHHAGTAIGVPGMVQELVDAVYAEDFAQELELDEATAKKMRHADGERLATEAAEHQLAELVKIDSPNNRLLGDLWRLSNAKAEVDESLITTRLGADSARLVCIYEQESGCWTLDEEGTVPVPGMAGRGRISAPEARVIAHRMIPVPGSWTGGDAELLELPPAWTENSTLAGWSIMPMRRSPEGRWHGRMRSGPVQYDPVRGIRQI